MSEWVLASIAVAIGGLMTWGVSRWYYVRAACALRTETENLQKLVTQICRGLEEAGLVEFNRDANGSIVGIKKYASVRISTSACLSARPEDPAGAESD